MKAENNKQEAAGTERAVVEGTEAMGYWEFKTKFCSDKGWQLRRIDPQTYEVLNSKREKIGILKSGEGFFSGFQEEVKQV